MRNFIIAEIGINHNGSVDTAKRLIDSVADYVFAVKLQHLTPRDFLDAEQYDAPHPRPENAFAATYGQHKEFLTFNVDELKELIAHAHARKIKIGVSVCDIQAALDCLPLDFDFFKIPSSRVKDESLYATIATNTIRPIHASLGMTTLDDRRWLMMDYRKVDHWYITHSDYSTDSIVYYQHGLNFSCHNPDPVYGIMAATQGSEFIEYHLTFDRSAKGTDHKISLLPEEFKWLFDNLKKLDNFRERPEGLPETEKGAMEKLCKNIL